jgi:DNA-binding HxlR family transcriptional regulator
MSNELCPKVESSLNMLGKKWVGLIIYTLMSGPKKFSDMEKFIPGLSSRLLNERLKELEKLGVIKKTIYSESAIRIEYELTRKGLDLESTFKNIGEWADKWN